MADRQPRVSSAATRRCGGRGSALQRLACRPAGGASSGGGEAATRATLKCGGGGGVRVPPGWRSAVFNSRPSYERRKRMDRGTRGHLLPTVGTDPTWTRVLACHTNKCGIFVASFILPPFRKN
jgi:hypothetical protein